jgi:hypothetical protein
LAFLEAFILITLDFKARVEEVKVGNFNLKVPACFTLVVYCGFYLPLKFEYREV